MFEARNGNISTRWTNVFEAFESAAKLLQFHSEVSEVWDLRGEMPTIVARITVEWLVGE